eukprot:CAMPEP_0197627096 /NCGR_PEP_ID=MMETSP1338-20131121/5801_1 /TAXON_ID=43686 ORGANISM="Pelagodinium beii, Strain RCC1491" /NCGR_SAMPLE_ID=MMETSP1338 /ASSEMBLY_ACC=CAM_ASM_000754 /LENGTH=68 /DNA_ID=CAMNT_0043197717 /DNA_START=485 /DNA_END=691 /DNA_ORIENTATION=+
MTVVGLRKSVKSILLLAKDESMLVMKVLQTAVVLLEGELEDADGDGAGGDGVKGPNDEWVETTAADFC